MLVRPVRLYHTEVQRLAIGVAVCHAVIANNDAGLNGLNGDVFQVIFQSFPCLGCVERTASPYGGIVSITAFASVSIATSATETSRVPSRETHHAQEQRPRDGPVQHTRLERRLMEQRVRLVMNIHKVQIHQVPSLPVEVIVYILGRGLGSHTLPFTCGRTFQASLQTLITGSWPSLITSSLSQSTLYACPGRPHLG
jgi:hypothetical protein